jgi:Fuc2NAc and GlcNAc transferase
MIIAVVSLAAFFASYVMTGWLARHLRQRQIVDQPNSRSSHSTPTPRGGGLSMVAVTTCGIAALWAAGIISGSLATVLIVGGLGIAAIGFWDDIRLAPVAVRMTVHFAAAVLAVYALGALSGIRVGNSVVHLGAAGAVLGVLAVVWILNLFNFMDGIDGIAASEAAFAFFGGAGILLFAAHGSPAEAAPALLAGAACCGFLRWNWPPAAIFMGDVGSGYLGYAIAVIALASLQTTELSLFTWMILSGVFFVDATLTLCRRVLRGKPVYEAHRTHAYQWLARRWGSHARVTTAVIAINIVWLLPCATLSVKFPGSAWWLCVVALAPLAMCAWLSGSGRPE